MSLLQYEIFLEKQNRYVYIKSTGVITTNTYRNVDQMSQVRPQIESYVFGQVHKKPILQFQIYLAVLFGPEAPTPCPSLLRRLYVYM